MLALLFFKMCLIPEILFLVATENDGINVNELESLLSSTQKSNAVVRPSTLGTCFAGMIYLVPVFNNPRGFCLSDGMFPHIAIVVLLNYLDFSLLPDLLNNINFLIQFYFTDNFNYCSYFIFLITLF